MHSIGTPNSAFRDARKLYELKIHSISESACFGWDSTQENRENRNSGFFVLDEVKSVHLNVDGKPYFVLLN